jgi:tetratricopeptide (TPR) repeat protein/predicted Ser/Thr protein kinase
MSTSFSGDGSFPPSLAQRVEQVCQAFEAAWREAVQRQRSSPIASAEQRPRIEDFLNGSIEPERSILLRELLGLDLVFRRSQGETPAAEEYAQRFPKHVALVGLVFQRATCLTLAPNAATTAGEALPEEAREPFPATLLFPVAAETLTYSGGSQTPRAAPAAKGQVLGDYELLELLGRGGMGVVYKARQRSANRIVALKLIRVDRLEDFPEDQRQEWLERFHTEAQAAARIEHEHVVTVYEVGEFQGHPFYSMRYIEGRSLAEMLRDGPLPSRKAAEYPEPVARAVHHAHTCGVLHRDLKPRNILVDKLDRPYVADFGLAKLTEGASDMTHTGAWLGTPSYMAPEQALDAAHVTAASDVYSLGATLYDLLTGRPPFQAATPAETLHQVLHQEPVPPRQLNPGIDHDLETICLKCLRKEAGRRYGTAAELADDLRRYLNGEPIQARPVGRVERTWRWCRRNRAVALLTAFVLTLLVALGVGGVITAVQFGLKAEQENRLRSEAEESAKQAQQVVNQFLRDVSENDLFDEPKLQLLRVTFLERALNYYKAFAEQRQDDPNVQAELAAMYLRVAEVYHVADRNDDMMSHLATGLDVVEQLRHSHPTATEAHRKLVGIWRGHRRLHRSITSPANLPQALANCQRFIDLWQKFAREHPDAPGFQSDVAAMHAHVGELRPDSSKFEAFEVALSIWERLASEYPQEGKYAEDQARMQLFLAIGWNAATRPRGEREKAARKAVAMYEKLAAQSPKVPFYREGLANCHIAIAQVAVERGASEEAIEALIAAQKRFDDLLVEFPAVPAYREGAAQVYMELGYRSEQSRPQQAEKAFRRALELSAPLEAEFQRYNWLLRNAHISLARVLRANGRAEDADKLLRQLIAYYEKLIAANPKGRKYYVDLANAYKQLGQPDKVIAQYTKLIELDPNQWDSWFQRASVHYDLGQWDKAIKDHSKVIELKPDHARSWYQRGQCHYNLRQWEKAVAEYARAVELGAAANDTHVWLWKGTAHGELGQWDLAVADHSQAIEKAPGDYHHWRARGTAYAHLEQWEKAEADFLKAIELNPHEFSGIGPELKNLGRLKEAERIARLAIEAYENRAAAEPTAAGPRDAQARIHFDLAALLQGAGELKKAEADSRRAIAIWEKLAADFPAKHEYLQHAAHAHHHQLGNLLNATGRPQEAAELYLKVAPLWEKLVAQFPHVLDYRLNLAQAHGLSGHWDKAVAEYSKALDLKQAQERVLYARGQAYVNLQQRDKALQDFSQAIALKADFWEAWVWRGWTYRDLQQWDKALADLSKTVELNATIWYVWRDRARVYAQRKQWDQARADLSEAIKRATDAGDAGARRDVHHWCMTLFNQQVEAGAHREALKTADELLRLSIDDPKGDNWAAYHQVAEALDRCVPLAEKDAKLSEAKRKDVARAYTEAAKQFVRDAVKHCPDDPEARNNLAWQLVRSAGPPIYEPAQAVELASKAVKSAPDAAHIRHTLGVAQYRAGDYRSALETLRKSAEMYGGNLLSQHGFFLAMVHWRLGEKDKAGNWYRASLLWMTKYQAKNEELLSFRTEAAALLGEHEPKPEPGNTAMPDDLEIYRLVLESDPAMPWAYLRRGRLYQVRGRLPAAVADLSRAVEEYHKLVAQNSTSLAPRVSLAHSHHELAGVLRLLRRTAESQQHYRQAIALRQKLVAEFPKLVDYPFQLAQSCRGLALLLRDTDRKEAEKALHEEVRQYDRLIELKPEHHVYWNNRGVAYADLGQRDKAIADYSKALQVGGGPKDAVVWSNRGFMYAVLGQWDKALADYSKALDMGAAKNAVVWFNRAQAHSALKQYDKAVADYSQALELQPAFVRAWIGRAAAHVKLNQPDKAVADLQQAVAKGLRDLDYLKKNADLEPLRSREDFRKLVDEVETKVNAASKEKATPP